MHLKDVIDYYFLCCASYGTLCTFNALGKQEQNNWKYNVLCDINFSKVSVLGEFFPKITEPKNMNRID